MRWHEEPPAADVTSDGIALPRTAQAVETVTDALRHAAAGPPLAVLMADLASAGTDWRAPGVDDDAVLADAVRDTGLSLEAYDEALAARTGAPQPPPAGMRVLAARLLRRVSTEQAGAWPGHFGGPEVGGRRLALAVAMLSEYLAPWAAQDTWVVEIERREELCRLFLAGMGLTPREETPAVALAGWEAVSVLASTEAAEQLRVEEERRRELEDALARKRAAEAASRYVGY